MKEFVVISAGIIICFLFLALSCEKQNPHTLSGLIWNRANATLIIDGPNWQYSNTSLRQPIWNPANPCYVACNTFTGANYAPEGTVLSFTPDTEPANQVPFCWNCHGGYSIARFGNTSTGIIHSSGNPVTYGE